MKFIVLAPKEKLGTPGLVLLSENLHHADFTAGREPLAAGFCDQFGNCWGQSDSLLMDWDEADEKFVKMMMQFSCSKPLTK